MTQPRVPDMVGAYARLSLRADALRAAGKPVPIDITRGMQAIEMRARATIPPDQFQTVIHHVEAAKARLYQTEVAKAKEQATRQAHADKETGVREVTRGLGLLGNANGLTLEQFEALKTGKKVPTGVRQRPDQETIDAEMRRRTSKVDPTGKGYTDAEWVRRLDALADASEPEFTRLAQQYKLPPQKLRELTDYFKENRLGYGIQERLRDKDTTQDRARDLSNAARSGVAVKKREPEPDEVEPADDDVRKAQLLDQYVKKTNWNDRRNADFITDAIPQRLLDNEFIEGDVARAWDEMENQEIANG